jgi:hypothetical protein
MGDPELTVRRLIDLAGTTYADEAGIRLRNEPMPLFQLLALCMLASKPIGADVATTAARAVFEAGIRTPGQVLAADRQSLIVAFGRAGYARYDESSATRLSEMATVVNDEYHGDLRNLALECGEDPARAHRALQRFKGIGDTGAGIFLREVQDVWPWVRPYFDERALTTADDLGLPTTPEELGELAPRTTARLAAALVRVSLSSQLRDDVLDPKQ